jgi:hypothetical protein
MFHAKYNHHTGTYALDGNAAPIKTSWHKYSRIHTISSRVICRNHAKELELRTLCWNLNVPYTRYSAKSYEWLSCAYHPDRLRERGGLPSLWNFTGSEQITFPWVLAGRISNIAKEQWRYRAKDTWWGELQQHGGMHTQMSESDIKMLLQPGQSQSQLCPVSLLLSLGLSNGCCLLGTTVICLYEKVLWKINYDKS